MAATDGHKGGVLLVLICCLLGCYGFHWNETVSHANATVVEACEGQTVTFRWLYDLDPSDRLHAIQWRFQPTYYENETDFLMASMISNNFLTVADWTGRLQFEPNAGLVLTFVGVGDSGAYTVVVDVERHGHGVIVSEVRKLELRVSQAPVLESSGLEAQLLPEARQVDGSGHWMLQLTCQGLRSLGQPPVNVVWKTPSGHVIQSSVINNVTAYLNLMTSAVEDGDYVCMVDNSSESAACASSHSPMFVGDSVSVDRVQARFAVLEGQMVALHNENQQMSHQLHSLTSENQQMAHQLQNVTSENQLLEHKAEEMSHQLQNVTTENQLLEQIAIDMDHQLKNLTDENEQLKLSVENVSQKQMLLAGELKYFSETIKLRGFGYDPRDFTHEPRSCDDVRSYRQSNGPHVIFPQVGDALPVYCDQETDSHGWLVIQRRQDGSVDFYRNWTDYEFGFGNITGEFWIGLQTLYQLTSRQNYSLRVDLEDFQGNTSYAVYTHFSVSGPADNYTLSVSSYSGTAGDSMASSDSNNGMQFTTLDRDHDTWSDVNCAVIRHSAWWFPSACGNSNPNGLYKQNGAIGDASIMWYYWHSDTRSMKHVEMKIRPRNG